MSIKQEYEDYAARREALAKTHFGPIWLNPLDIKIKKPRVSNHKVTTLLIQNPRFWDIN